MPKMYKLNNKKLTIGRINIISLVTTFLFIVLTISLFYIQIVKNQEYRQILNEKLTTIVYGSTAPRGRIFDRNGKLIVDNEAIKVIYYKKNSGVTITEEIDLAYRVASLIDVDYKKITTKIIKDFWLVNNREKGADKISEEEYQKVKEKKLSSSDIYKLKIDRITDSELQEFNELDKEAAYIYYLMNNGYIYEEKNIDENVSEIEYAIIAERIDSLNGFNIKIDWQRKYQYGNVFRSILGTVSNGLPLDLKDYYLKDGYILTDKVGVSYLEYQYDKYLKGEKDIYEVDSNKTYTKIKQGKRGSDITLTIDIELQKEIENILEKEIRIAQTELNTNYYNRSFVIVSNPNTGEIIAMSGKQIIDGKVFDYTPGVITSSVVAGSSIKGASHIVGYNTGALKIGEIRNDSCIKIASTPPKCSWTYLGYINDISALTQSSNTYQFLTAIKVGGGVYQYNGPLVVNKEAFNIYRNTFMQFGLGVLTGIDLPNEISGLKGKNDSPGLLLDFSIGQYDTYTPIQLSQYIGTIANGGKRIRPYLLKKVTDNYKNTIYEEETTVLNTINTDIKFLNRVKLGLRTVITSGTGYGYIAQTYNAAGKTGTSQSYIDTNNDHLADTETLTHVFVSYAPYDNPTVTFTVISPDIGISNTAYTSNVNKRIAYQVSQKYFQFYK